MAQRKRTIRKLTATEKSRLTKAMQEEDAAMDENIKVARQKRAEHDSAVVNASIAAVEFLNRVREEAGISVRALAERTGLQAGNISRLRSQETVTLQTLEKLASGLGYGFRIEFYKETESADESTITVAKGRLKKPEGKQYRMK